MTTEKVKAIISRAIDSKHFSEQQHRGGNTVWEHVQHTSCTWSAKNGENDGNAFAE
jgi:hypothetical protein